MNISTPKADLLRLNPMNEIKFYFILGFLCLIFTSTHAITPVYSVEDLFTDSELEQQVLSMETVFDVRYNEEIKDIINIYVSSGRRNSEAILGRSNYYFPIMENIIERHNMPEEIKYLSVIESGLSPTVKSRVGAVGLWQFMSSTAKMYDLRIGSTHDERKDVAKSTEAALLYLNDLYERFGDWTVALAAYNCGPGNINKAIVKSGGKKSYWEIRKYLPKETRRYLPKLIATMYVMKYFEQYGLDNLNHEFSDHRSFGMAIVNDKISFEDISEYSGIAIEDIQKYNPSYAHNYIPSSKKGNTLILPEVYLLTYLQNKGQMDLLHHVFYLKNALFSISQENKLAKEQIVEVESTRTTIQTSVIQLNLLEAFPLKEVVNEIPEIGPIQLEDNAPVTLKRLRKRESLKDLEEKGGVYNSSEIINVSANGVISFKE